MTAPVQVSPGAPASGGNPLHADQFVSDEFISEVVKGYDEGLPDKNDPNDTEQIPAHEPESPPKKAVTPKAKNATAEGDPASDPAAPETKEGEPAATPRKLAAEFTLYDKDGDELDVNDVLDKVVEVGVPYKGEVRKMPLDRVVRLAQTGFANEKLYAEATDAIRSYETLETAYNDSNSSIERQNKFIQDILTDETKLQDARAKLAQFHTPEARALRAEQRYKELEQRTEQRTSQTDAASFFENDVKPGLAALTKEYPTLTIEEVIGKFNIATAKYGQAISPKDFAAIRAILRDDLPAWAAGLHETRDADRTTIRRVREQNTLLKKTVASGARPSGRSATAADGQAAPKKAKNLDEMVENLVDAALQDL